MPDLLGQGFRANLTAQDMMRAFALLLMSSALFAAGNVTDDLSWIDRLGGRLERNPAGEVVAVHLRGTWVTDSEVRDLVRLPKLDRLDLSHTRITDDGLLYLKPAAQIQDLNLFYAEQITDQGMTAIKEWKHLKRLNLRGTRVFDGTLAILSGLTQLEALDIAYTQITDNGLDALVPLVQLRELAIGRSKLNKNAIEVLRLLPTLEYLDLGGPHPGPGGYRNNAGSPMDDDLPRAIAELKNLHSLKLNYSQIRSDGIRILASLDQLSKLSLTGCPRVDDAVLTELAKYKALKYLDVQETSVTRQGVDQFKKTEPGVVILWQ